MFDEVSGMVSTEKIGQAVDDATADPSVEAIVLDIDSPGGSVYGVESLALKIRAATDKKKLIAVSNSLAASGAYWIASNASEVVVSPDGEVGSIGVFQMHRDVSRATDAAGVKVTYVKAGKYKTAGNPYEPLSPESMGELQKGVDDYYELFVRAVARGRNVSLTKVREGFGQGGTVRAREAVAEGMADRISTLDDILSRYGVSAADLVPMASQADIGNPYGAKPAETAPAAKSHALDVETRRRRLRMD
jgi:signal peptide peptidase SppA